MHLSTHFGNTQSVDADICTQIQESCFWILPHQILYQADYRRNIKDLEGILCEVIDTSVWIHVDVYLVGSGVLMTDSIVLGREYVGSTNFPDFDHLDLQRV